MLKLFDSIRKSMVRHYMKEQKRQGVDQVASAYVDRLLQNRTLPSVVVQQVWDTQTNHFRPPKGRKGR